MISHSARLRADHLTRLAGIPACTNKKAKFFLNPELALSADAWLKQATTRQSLVMIVRGLDLSVASMMATAARKYSIRPSTYVRCLQRSVR